MAAEAVEEEGAAEAAVVQEVSRFPPLSRKERMRLCHLYNEFGQLAILEDANHNTSKCDFL